VQACLLGQVAFESAMESPDAGDWEKCCRTMATLAVKLRLSPQSRTDPNTIMRAIAGQSVRETGVSLEDLAAIRDGARGWTCRG